MTESHQNAQGPDKLRKNQKENQSKPQAKQPNHQRSATRSRPEQELDVLIRARYPIVYVESWEEERVENCLRKIAKFREKEFYTWTVTQGLVKSDTAMGRTSTKSDKTADPLLALNSVIEQVSPSIYLFKDFHRFTEDTRCNLSIIRRLRDVAYHLRDSYKTIIIVAPMVRIAPELSKDVTVLQYELPQVKDFDRLLARITDDVKDNPKVEIDLSGQDRWRLLNAARGLTLKEAENVFAKTLVLDGKLNSDDVGVIFSEKQQIIRKNGLLEYYETDETFRHVAGLSNMKSWISKRATAFTDEAVEFGLPAPRGMLLLGVQGCGKSLCAKAVSSSWELPLLRFDIGRMFSGLVGSSEENMRSAIQTAESVAPAILWIDEIDKAFAGGSGGGTDGGTSARVFGTLLTWLSEKTASVFVIATANDISHLPPELLRKGRFDEIFFVDLPNQEERQEILKIHTSKRGWDPADFDLPKLAEECDGFSGAEIEEAIISSLFDAFSDGEGLTTMYVARAIAETVPLSKTMSEDLQKLRSWANGRARMASDALSKPFEETRRKIEL